MENNLEKEFITYEQALALKELEFDKPCLAYWNYHTQELNYNSHPSTFHSKDVIQLPLKQQVFRWFREKYEFYYHIFPLQITASDKTGYRYSWEIYNHTPEWIAEDRALLGSLTYEEAENACIDKLIELVK
jgi:hypothetical protein